MFCVNKPSVEIFEIADASKKQYSPCNYHAITVCLKNLD